MYSRACTPGLVHRKSCRTGYFMLAVLRNLYYQRLILGCGFWLSLVACLFFFHNKQHVWSRSRKLFCELCRETPTECRNPGKWRQRHSSENPDFGLCCMCVYVCVSVSWGVGCGKTKWWRCGSYCHHQPGAPWLE